MKYMNINKVCFSYTDYPFLEDISFKVKENEGCIVLVGRNGSGKSTLLNILNDLLPYKGRIDSTFESKAYLPYENPLFDELSVEQNIKFYYRCYHKKNIAYDSPIVKQIFHALSIDYLKQKVSKCSSGEKKKVSIACLLLTNADFIILDEPFVAMDYNSVNQLITLINEWKQNKVFLITTHSINLAEKFIDRLLILNEGKLVTDTFDKKEIKKYFEGC